jgi:L-lactate dehydrogenase complex protein LldG
MSSRAKILEAIGKSKPALNPLPEIKIFQNIDIDLIEKYKTIAVSVGSKVIPVSSFQEIETIIKTDPFFEKAKIFSNVEELQALSDIDPLQDHPPHYFQDVDITILKTYMAVAENGAVWLPENVLNHRITPFITQHLVVIIHAKDILENMHMAYEKIGMTDYGYGVFIGGPSKTADIEQSLVLGAHGARSLTIFLLN